MGLCAISKTFLNFALTNILSVSQILSTHHLVMRRLIRVLTLFMLLSVPGLLGAREFVVVVDPGHGGRDGGAVGLRTNEKSINLKVAEKLKRYIEEGMPDARVKMTRSDDRFISLQGRADMANSSKADVFISIHANSLDRKSPNYSRVHGAAVYTLGLDRSQTNLEVAMRENEVMKLEDDYIKTYEGFDPSSSESYIVFEMMQHKNMDQSIALAEAVQNQLVRTAGRKNNGVRQAPFWVLVRTGMPAILVELDFISNPAQEKFMASEEGSGQLAKAIYNGLKRYRDNRSGGVTTRDVREEKAPEARPEPPKETPAETTGEIVYKIQFLTSPRRLPAGDASLKGLKDVDYYRDGSTYKYTSGAFGSMKEAAEELKKVKKRYADAFVIKTVDGKRIK